MDSVAKVLSAWNSNFPNPTVETNVGTTPSCAKPTSDRFQAALIRNCRLFRSLAENQPHCLFLTYATLSATFGHTRPPSVSAPFRVRTIDQCASFGMVPPVEKTFVSLRDRSAGKKDACF